MKAIFLFYLILFQAKLLLKSILIDHNARKNFKDFTYTSCFSFGVRPQTAVDSPKGTRLVCDGIHDSFS